MLVLDDDKRTFEFELDGIAYSVTALDAMPLKRTESLKGVTDDQAAVAWIRSEVFERECPEAMDRMTVGQWKTLLKAYIEDSPATPGELSASPS